MKYAINMFWRFLNLFVSVMVAYKAFNFVFHELYSYLPRLGTLQTLNEGPIGTVLRENSTGLRDAYNNAFEKSIMYSLIVFVLTFIALEYVRLADFIKFALRDLRKDIKEIKTINQ